MVSCASKRPGRALAYETVDDLEEPMFTAVSYCPIAGVAGAAYTLSCVSKRPRPSLY